MKGRLRQSYQDLRLSVVGATFLTGIETVLTLDMGGTTTDIGISKTTVGE